MDLSKHIVTNINDPAKPFHSSGFAEVANADHFGATSNMTFEQRKQIMQNRVNINNSKRLSTGNEIRITPIARPVTGHFVMPQRPSLRQQRIIGDSKNTFKR